MKHVKWKILFFLVGVLVFGYSFLASDSFFAVSRFGAIGINTTQLGMGERLRQGVFILNYLVSLVVLISVMRINNVFLKTFLLSLFVGALVFENAYSYTMGRPPSFSDIFAMNLALVTNLGDATKEFSDAIFKAVGWTALILVSGYLASRVPVFKRQNLKILLGGFSYLFLSYFAALYMRGEPAVIGFPKGFNYVVGTSLLVPASFLTTGIQPLEAFSSPIAVDKIVLIIDESVSRDRFDVSKFLVPSSYLFFDSFSSANCSAASNFFLRKGYRVGNTAFQTRSLFELAKTAGYETTYIDTQGVLRDPTTRNYFDREELSFVDNIFDIEKLFDTYERDIAALDIVIRVLAEQKKSFLILNKYGTHFPYWNNLPPGQRSFFDRELDYQRSMERVVYPVLNKLVSVLDDSTVVFYTSDHGQNVAGPATHCNSGPNSTPVEWEVMSGVFAKKDSKLGHLLKGLETQNIFFSHFELTESIRNLLGFHRPEVGSLFKWKLLSRTPDKYCHFYGPPLGFFGKPTSCVEHPVLRK
jgi:glucan phosphoethanolaminetransferase (alkaline phosphatase superfamily)